MLYKIRRFERGDMALAVPAELRNVFENAIYADVRRVGDAIVYTPVTLVRQDE